MPCGWASFWWEWRGEYRDAHVLPQKGCSPYFGRVLHWMHSGVYGGGVGLAVRLFARYLPVRTLGVGAEGCAGAVPAWELDCLAERVMAMTFRMCGGLLTEVVSPVRALCSASIFAIWLDMGRHMASARHRSMMLNASDGVHPISSRLRWYPTMVNAPSSAMWTVARVAGGVPGIMCRIVSEGTAEELAVRTSVGMDAWDVG